MKLKMVGLGKMGFNLALNMKDHEVDVEGFDVNEEARKKAEESGIKSYETLKDLVSADQKDVIWVMLPAGKITNSVLDELSGLCKKGDIVIDGGNSDHRDSLKTAKKMEEKGIYFFDIGTSGGVYGARHGASFMCGGEIRVKEYLKFDKENYLNQNMDEQRKIRNEQYALLGEYLIEKSDILIAVYDKNRDMIKGGTIEIVNKFNLKMNFFIKNVKEEETAGGSFLFFFFHIASFFKFMHAKVSVTCSLIFSRPLILV